jgi:hypothetical protein
MYARVAKPDCWKRGAQPSLGDSFSGLVKTKVKTSCGWESIKDLTVCK